MNFKNILSKSSVESSTSSKISNESDEIIKLQNDIETLTQNVSSLKILLESRDSAIGTLAREKEKLYVELKSMQRINTHLQQQLLNEREMHAKEKKNIVDNVNSPSKTSSTKKISNKEISDEQCISDLQIEIISKDEVIFTLCRKYLKLKKCKYILQKKYETLQRNCGEVCQNVIKILKDNKNFINSFLNELAKATISTNQDNYNINLVKVNNDLQFENTQLKLYQVSKIYLGESTMQEESGIDNSPSAKHIWNRYNCNQEEAKSLQTRTFHRSTINLKNNNKNIYLKKALSDSNLYTDFYN